MRESRVKIRKRTAESGGKEGSGGGDGVRVGGGDTGQDSLINGDGVRGKLGDGESCFAFGQTAEASEKHETKAVFLVKHSEEEDIVQGWKDYFHRMNEQDVQCDSVEPNDEEHQTSRRVEGKPGALKFTAEEYSAWCLPWMNSLIIKRWRPNFNPWKADLQCNITAWIWLPDVPFEFYNVESLQRIGNMVGKMIKIDRPTSIYEKGGFAHICMEIDLKQPLLPTYMVFGEERPIIYEGLHQVCFECGKYGHQRKGCPMRQKEATDKAEDQENGEPVTGGGGGCQPEKESRVVGSTRIVTGEEDDADTPFGKIWILRRDFGGVMSSAGIRNVFKGHMQ
ncbi:hypothetical protein K1719_012271 [Acacia pycnantha]|nr:hypothetical protein K1719_012271 [Acacia pycnantha]